MYVCICMCIYIYICIYISLADQQPRTDPRLETSRAQARMPDAIDVYDLAAAGERRACGTNAQQCTKVARGKTLHTGNRHLGSCARCYPLMVHQNDIIYVLSRSLSASFSHRRFVRASEKGSHPYRCIYIYICIHIYLAIYLYLSLSIYIYICMEPFGGRSSSSRPCREPRLQTSLAEYNMISIV